MGKLFLFFFYLLLPSKWTFISYGRRKMDENNRKKAIGYRIKRIRISIFIRQLAPLLHYSGVHRTVGEYSTTPSNNSYRYLLSDTIKPKSKDQRRHRLKPEQPRILNSPPRPVQIAMKNSWTESQLSVCLSAYASVPWAPSDTNGHRMNHL